MADPPAPAQPAQLMTRLSSTSPRSATIISRTASSASAPPTYELRVGTLPLRGVTLDEVLAFVSPQELETFENTWFRRDTEEADRRAVERRERRSRGGRHHHHHRRGSLAHGGSDDGDGYGSGELDGDAVALTHQSSADDTDVAVQRDVELVKHGRPRPSYSHLYKRGRRGRGRGRGGLSRADAVQQRQQQREAADDLIGDASSLTLLYRPKRRRLTVDGPRSGSVSTVDETSTSEGASSAPPNIFAVVASPSATRGLDVGIPQVDMESAISTASSVVSSSSVDGDATGTVPQSTLAAPSAVSDGDIAMDEAESSDANSEAYEIESILTHGYSDPSTHPMELGKDPVLLYQVKWAGYDEPTWEPEASFDDESILRVYWARVSADEVGRPSGSGWNKGRGKSKSKSETSAVL